MSSGKHKFPREFSEEVYVTFVVLWSNKQTNRNYWNFALGYDVEYTETDRKDIQNLAQEIETKYTQYGKSLVYR